MSYKHGLSNKNEQNCFLNSLLQVFLRLSELREYILTSVSNHTCTDQCLYCAIQNVLISLIHSNAPVSSTLVRAALLHESNSVAFFYNEKGCVIETFEFFLNYYHSVYSGIEKTEASCGNQCLSHRVFGFQSILNCKCSNTQTELVELSDHFGIYINGAEFKSYFKLFGKLGKFTNIVNAIINNDERYTRKSMCGCGEEVVMMTTLISSPKVLVFFIQWEDLKLKGSYKMIDLVNTRFALFDIFNTDSISTQYRFRGMVCYSKHAKHYFTVFCDEDYNRWNYLDDTRVFSLNSWSAFKLSLKVFRISPVLLFYEAI